MNACRIVVLMYVRMENASTLEAVSFAIATTGSESLPLSRAVKVSWICATFIEARIARALRLIAHHFLPILHVYHANQIKSFIILAVLRRSV